jgi:uncharacterized membrane protein HdeD (DUF308 family)
MTIRRCLSDLWRVIGLGTGKQGNITKLTLAAYIVIASAPFVYAAAHARFWDHRHYREPVSTALFLTLLIALMLRHRWAWLLLTAFTCIVLISYPWTGGGVVGLLGSALSLGLLVSPQMRQYVHKEWRSSGS